MSHHNIEVCVCGNVLSRCRCMGPHATVVRPGRCVCAHPKQPPAGAAPTLASSGMAWMLERPKPGQIWRRYGWANQDHVYEVVLGQRSLAEVQSSLEEVREIYYAVSGGRVLVGNGVLPLWLAEWYLLMHFERVDVAPAGVGVDLPSEPGPLTEKAALEDRAATAGLRVHQLEQELAAKDAAFSGVNAQLGEYEELFKLQRTRVAAAEKLWKAAHPEAPETLVPDLGELVGWLMSLAFKSESLAELDELALARITWTAQFGDGRRFEEFAANYPSHIKEAARQARAWMGAISAAGGAAPALDAPRSEGGQRDGQEG